MKRKRVLTNSVMGVFLMVLAGVSLSVQASQDNLKVVLNTFQWFNKISKAPHPHFTQQEVGLYFTEDADMITNNKHICHGVLEHYEHFLALNAHYQSLQVDMSGLKAQVVGDRVYLDYALHGIKHQGQKEIIYVMGYMVIQDGKINRFKEIIHHELLI